MTTTEHPDPTPDVAPAPDATPDVEQSPDTELNDPVHAPMHHPDRCPDCGANPGDQHMPDCEIARRTALMPHESEIAAHALMLPTAAMWSHIQRIADDLAQSGMVGKAYIGKPNNILLVGLYCHDLGIQLSQGLSQMFVIDGKVGMAASLMSALIERAGHSVEGDIDRDDNGRPVRAEVIVHQQDGRVRRADFTVTDAIAAGLCTRDDSLPNGVKARDGNGKALPWERYTADMLWARALSRVARRFYAGELCGIMYTPEELPGYVWAEQGATTGTSGGSDSEPAWPEPQTPLSDDQRLWLNRAMQRATALDKRDAVTKALRTAADAGVIPPRDKVGGEHYEKLKALLIQIVGDDDNAPPPTTPTTEPDGTEPFEEAEVIETPHHSTRDAVAAMERNVAEGKRADGAPLDTPDPTTQGATHVRTVDANTLTADELASRKLLRDAIAADVDTMSTTAIIAELTRRKISTAYTPAIMREVLIDIMLTESREPM